MQPKKCFWTVVRRDKVVAQCCRTASGPDQLCAQRRKLLSRLTVELVAFHGISPRVEIVNPMEESQ